MICRRMFLRGATGAGLAIPFLPSLQKRARAQQPDGVPIRYVQFQSRFGRPPDHWYPDDPTEQVGPHVHRRTLNDYQGPLSYILDTKWNTLRDKMTLIRGLDGMCTPWNNHSLAFVGTGGANEPGSSGTDPPAAFKYSIDSVLDASSVVYPTAPKMRSLRMTPLAPGQNTPGDGPRWSFSWNGGNRPVPAIEKVQAAFDTVFGGDPLNPVDDTPLRQKRKLVDLVVEDYRRVRNKQRLSNDDHARLENYLTLVSDLQERLNVDRAACAAPDLGGAPNNARLHSNAIDVLVAALACDATRVASYTVGPFTYTETPFELDLHTAAHDNQNVNRFHNHWVAERVYELMTKMNQIEETNGKTLLDNSIAYYGNGAAQGDHGHVDHPVLIAGGGGKLRMGEYIDYRQRPFVDLPVSSNQARSLSAGRPYNELLVTLMRAMGLQPSDWRRLGQTSGFGFYNLEQHNQLGPIYKQFLNGDRDAGLPHFLV